MMKKALVPGAVLALFFLAGCGSSGIGDLGDILGGGGGSTAAMAEIRGTVDSIDTGSRSILLTNVSQVSASLREGNLGSGATARVYYDNDTPVNYQGQVYRPEDLERGDQVAVRVEQSGDRLHADSMTVTYNSSTGTSTGAAMTNVRGSVSYVDTSRRTIAIDRGTGYGGTVTVEYDTNTDVLYQGRRYTPADLERGDEIEVDVRDYGSGRLLAQDIQVLRSASETTTSASTLRGTVRSVDTSRRLIQLDSANWISRFNAGTLGSTVTVQYETNASVEYQGQLYPMTNLERGDVVDVRVRTVGSTLIAEEVRVVRDVNARF